MMTFNITKEELTIFLEYLNEQPFGKCEACGELKCLLEHHWYNQDDIAKYFADNRKLLSGEPFPTYTKHICGSCNNWLTRKNLEPFAKTQKYYFINEFKNKDKSFTPGTHPNWIWSHILPPFEIQKLFIQYQLHLYDSDKFKQSIPELYDKYTKKRDSAIRVFNILKEVSNATT